MQHLIVLFGDIVVDETALSDLFFYVEGLGPRSRFYGPEKLILLLASGINIFGFVRGKDCTGYMYTRRSQCAIYLISHWGH